jgi:hypothetical protein
MHKIRSLIDSVYVLVCVAGFSAVACEKTKFKSGQPMVPPVATASPVASAMPTAGSPNELNRNSPVGPGQEVVNPQPPPVAPPVKFDPLPAPVTGTTPVNNPPLVENPTVVLPGLGGKPVVTIPPKVPTTPTLIPTVPPDKVLVQLRVAQLNYEAWWKNCLIVTIGSDTKEVGCNKTTPLNTIVYFFADKNACNRLDVRVQTYYPQTGACKPLQACNGPYNPYPNQDRRTGEISSAVFFRAYDRNNILRRDPLIGIQDSTQTLKQEMDAFAASAPMSRWVRVYFEDQYRSNLDAVLAEPSNMTLRETRGIDFNDYVFDVIAQGVEYYIDGLEPMGCVRK